jgi:hypothetical protein
MAGNNNPYKKYLETLGGAQTATGDLFGQLLSTTQGSKQGVSDRYAMMGEELRQMADTASGQASSGYGAARQRVQAAPVSYVRPDVPAPQVGAVPMVGADAATVANLQAAAEQSMGAGQAALNQMYDLLAQSDAANRASRLSDIGIAETSDLSQLAALAQAQRFGLGQSEAAEIANLDALINQIQRDQIAADLGFGDRELAALQGSVAFDESRAQFDTDALTQSVDIFRNMIDPIVDVIDPESIIRLWMAFSEEIGMPMSQASELVGSL